MNTVIVIGSTRPERKSAYAAELVAKIAKEKFQINTKIVDPLDIKLEYDSDTNEEWDKLTDWADSFVIIVPEYNHGYPGRLKTLLDAQYNNYPNKALLLCGLSSGPFGGTRAVENLLPITKRLGLVSTQSSIYFSSINDIFDESGGLLKADWSKRVEDKLGDLVELNKRLKSTLTA